MKTKKMNLRMLALSIIALVSLANATGQTLTKTFTVKFDPKDFTVEQIGTERKCEIFSNLNFGHGELGEPDLPHVTYNILLPDNYRVHSFTYSVGNDTCRINRIYFYPTAEAFLNNTPDTLTVDSIPLYPTPLTVSGPGPHPDAPQYPLETFPTKIEHVGARKLDDYRLEKFRICPFTYYAAEQKLVLSTYFNLTVSIIPYNNEKPSHTGIQDERIKEITYNLEDFGKGTENWMPNSTESDKGEILDYTPSIIGSVWSYTDFNGVKEITKEEEVIYYHSFTRYTVTDDPIMFNGETYYPLMEYQTCEYQPEEAVLVAYLRQDKDKIYKYTAADNSEVLLYDFSLNSGETVRISEQNIPIKIGEKNTIKSVDNIDFEKYSMIYWIKDDSINWEGNITSNEWIRYIGGVRDFLEEYKYNGSIYVTTTVGYGRMLNYYRSGDGKVVYKNGLKFWNWTYDDFMEDDCAIPNKIEDLIKEKKPAIIQTSSSTLLCTAPNAVKLEVYTMDAIKVGEARFVDGKAAVKVGQTPAIYLYIVTYPDGRRESGKAMVSEE